MIIEYNPLTLLSLLRLFMNCENRSYLCWDTFQFPGHLCPKIFFASILHFALTLRTGLHIPNPDVIAATLQAQTTYLASVGRGYISNDTTYHDVLDGMAVRAEHGRNLLTEQPSSLIHLSLVTTGLTAIFSFPRHLLNSFTSLLLNSLLNLRKLSQLNILLSNYLRKL